MDNATLIITLAIVTLVLALGYGIWQRVRVTRAKTQGTRSALTMPEPGVDKEARARAAQEPTRTD